MSSDLVVSMTSWFMRLIVMSPTALSITNCKVFLIEKFFQDCWGVSSCLTTQLLDQLLKFSRYDFFQR